MRVKKKVARRTKAPQKRDMDAFCEELWAKMRVLPALEGSRLRNQRLAELTHEELLEYGRLARIGSNLNWYVGLAS